MLMWSTDSSLGQEQVAVWQRDLEAVIGRAVLDEAFRHLLFADPDTALASYELTEDELAALKRVDAESMDASATVLDGRIRRNLA